MTWVQRNRVLWAVAILGLALPVVPPVQAQEQPPDLVRHGADLAAKNGCGACHSIPGVTGADGEVGPPLAGMGPRIYIAGMLNNTPENMELWLRDPQQIVPENAMPSTGLSEDDARAVATYIESLK
jgi:cytochrome c1